MSSLSGGGASVSVSTQTTYHASPGTLSDGGVDGLECDNKGNLKTADQTMAISVLNQIDNAVGPLYDASVNTINGSAGAFKQVVASLGNACKRIRIADTTGQFIGVYTGASGFEVLAFIINPGMDSEIKHAIAAATRVSIRAMGSGSITVGNLTMQFSG